jgi:putative membrane protein
MVLPGISGSFVLLILHKYEYVLGGLGEFIHPAAGGGRLEPLLDVVLPFALGCGVGIVGFSRFLGWLLGFARQATLSFMTGLMIGSLYLIWPYQHLQTIVVREKVRVIGSTPTLPDALDAQVLGVVVLAVLGCAGVVGLEVLARRRHGPGPEPAPEPLS